jgi:uncharacterized membrane protein
MGIAALIAWLVTAVAGFVMLGIWISGGGHRPESASRLTPGLVFTHFPVAVAGLVLWIVYLAVGSTALAWIAFVLLLAVAVVGFTMFARWLTSRRSERAAESRFPMAVVLGHGLVAAGTLVLVLLSALGVAGG